LTARDPVDSGSTTSSFPKTSLIDVTVAFRRSDPVLYIKIYRDETLTVFSSLGCFIGARCRGAYHQKKLFQICVKFFLVA